MAPIKAAVVILNWNGKKFLEQFLPSVTEHLPSFARIIVADNGSADDSVSFLRENYPAVDCIEFAENHGYTGGYNRALELIEAEYYILLNSDIEVSKGWIEPIIQHMDRNPSVAACQPVIRSWHEPGYFEYAGAAGGYIDYLGYPFCRGRVFDELETDAGQYKDIADVFWATGACMFVRAEAFWKVGGLDEDFFAHMEEIDLCWRLQRAGMQVRCIPQSVVYHVGGGTLPRNNPRKTYLNFRNNLWLLIKNLPGRLLWLRLFQRLCLDELAAAHFFFKGQFKDFFAVYKAWFSALARFRRKRKQATTLPFLKSQPVYNRSIVWDYYILKRKNFSDLPEKAFHSIPQKKTHSNTH